MTLAVVHTNDRVLLGMKKRGFGEGRWNGFGGKVNDGETIVNAAKRELLEESGLAWIKGEAAGVLTFFNGGGSKTDIEMHIFRVREFQGDPKESDEMLPQWFAFNKIPFADMWPDDPYWLPKFLQGSDVHGWFRFLNSETITEHELHFS